MYVILVLVIIGAVFLWDQQKHSIDPIIEQDSLEMYGKVIYMEDFPKNSLYHNADFADMRDNVLPEEIWWSPELAFVPVIFDEKWVLFTTKRFLSLPQTEQDTMDNYYITDLKTFQEISHQSDAKAEYAQVSVNIHWNPFWVFDPYLAEQSTWNANRW